MIQYSENILNRNVAPGITNFTTADVPDLRSMFDQSEYWISNYYLNSIDRTLFGQDIKGTARLYTINMLSRAHAQFTFYHQARDATHKYLEKSFPYNPAVKLYFEAVILWESCFLNYQIFFDLYRKWLGIEQVFKPEDDSDDSEEKRAYYIANSIKHWGGTLRGGTPNGNIVKESQFDGDYTIPMWLSNTGFHSHSHTHKYSITYAELAALITEVAKTADELENPWRKQSNPLVK